jgi:hypothetical protein
LTSEDWIVPAARRVDTTASPCSVRPIAIASSKVVVAAP